MEVLITLNDKRLASMYADGLRRILTNYDQHRVGIHDHHRHTTDEWFYTVEYHGRIGRNKWYVIRAYSAGFKKGAYAANNFIL